MGFAVPLLAAGNAAMSAFGALEQGQAQANSDKYNGQIAMANSQIATRNAVQASEAGEIQAANAEARTRAGAGAIKTNQAASGIDVNKGSAVDIQQSESQLGKLDALTIRSNAAKQAYGYETQSFSDAAQSNLDQYAAKNDIQASEISATSTLLGQSSNAASKFQEYQQASGFVGG